MTGDALNSGKRASIRLWFSGLLPAPSWRTGAAARFLVGRSEQKEAGRQAQPAAGPQGCRNRAEIDSIEKVLVRILASVDTPDRATSGIRGIGVDVVDILRIKRLLHGSNQFAHRWFTSDEIEQCSAANDRVRAYARRLAAKEAVWKALGLEEWEGGVPWHQIATFDGVGGFSVESTGSVAEACVGLALEKVRADYVDLSGCTIAVAVVTEGRGGLRSTLASP